MEETNKKSLVRLPQQGSDSTQLLFRNTASFAYTSDDDGASETENPLTPSISSVDFQALRPNTAPKYSSSSEKNEDMEPRVSRPKSVTSTTKRLVSILGRTELIPPPNTSTTFNVPAQVDVVSALDCSGSSGPSARTPEIRKIKQKYTPSSSGRR